MKPSSSAFKRSLQSAADLQQNASKEKAATLIQHMRDAPSMRLPQLAGTRAVNERVVNSERIKLPCVEDACGSAHRRFEFGLPA